MSSLPAVAAMLPLAWARCYTAGLPPPLRERRLAEIRSDTYEHTRDPSLAGHPFRQAWDILQSFLRGFPDDLRWRASNMPSRLWLLEVASLAIALGVLGASFALAQTTNSTSFEVRVAVGIAGAVVGASIGICCAVSLRASASKPFLFTRLPENPAGSASRGGEPVSLQSFARASGWLLIAAGLFQALSFAVTAGRYDYFDGTDALLNSIDEAPALYAVAIAAAALTAPLLIPLFVYLSQSANDAQRGRAITAVVLVSIHVALWFVALALFAVLLPISGDFTGATGQNAESLLTQAQGFTRLYFLVIQPAGVAMAIALILASWQMRSARIAPRWLTGVGVLLAISYLPPVAGGFIVTYPLFLVWTMGIGLILLRRTSGPMLAAAPLAA